MVEWLINGLGVAGLWLAVECCLHRQTAESLEEASLIPFADDPEVARRVELATGKKVNAVAAQVRKPGWGRCQM
ncbi:cbb3-type cytochrome c oxidase subunit 3 [Pseudomonas mandelii]|uniref:cbb3-type cytochrome c oxidase subunit 3 n=1 Tax=Pseudomonas mandelii TaxID=75612 RepID=UPI00224ADBA1|nr:cbb3-type cytochrome c oxidase subunit 3 [Pseudomonas mandelii]MCX2898174.1 cbb3-type cytochrome c oxidase subunit 3 [Pseudomonas mandelii]